MKLEIAILAGPEAKGFLADLSKQLDRMEKLKGGAKAAAVEELEEADTKLPADDDDDFAPKATAKAKGFDEDDDAKPAPKATKKAAAKTEEDDDNDFTAPPKAAKKPAAKKLTADDVNDACKARASRTGGKAGRNEVLKILKNNYDVESVTELEASQYAEVIAALQA